MKRKSSRRDFLKGRSAADAMADAVRQSLPDDAPLVAADPGAVSPYLVQIGRWAMACQFEVRLPATRQDHGTQAALQALDLIDALEDQLSVFRETSEICHINRTAGDRPVEVEPRLFELLQLAVRLYDETGGAFDLTSNPLWEVWGFARRAGRVPNEDELADALQRVGTRWIGLDPEHKTIRFLKPGVRLNLGSIGKGYALDRSAETLLAAGLKNFLVHSSGSSVLVHGFEGPAEEVSASGRCRGWAVGLRHPLRPDQRLGEIQLRDRALSTSGSRAQSFVHQGRRYGHILDPRTGQPAADVVSATALAPTAAMADALSTAFYVMGADRAIEYCGSRPEIGVLMVCPIRHSGGVEIRTAGVADDDWTPV
jgi:thiamine biosynthesis lipoprotein